MNFIRVADTEKRQETEWEEMDVVRHECPKVSKTNDKNDKRREYLWGTQRVYENLRFQLVVTNWPFHFTTTFGLFQFNIQFIFNLLFVLF